MMLMKSQRRNELSMQPSTLTLRVTSQTLVWLVSLTNSFMIPKLSFLWPGLPPSVCAYLHSLISAFGRWRNPALSLHGIEGAFSEPGAKTVIPRHVRGKFSIRLVPHQTPERVAELVKAHLEDQFQKLGSPNKLSVVCHHGSRPWVSTRLSVV